MGWREVLSEDLVSLGLSGTWRYRYVVTHRIAVFLRVLRICEYYRDKRGLARVYYYLSRYRLERMSESLGFDIPLGTFGPGLSIAHRGTIVVNGEARIGANCRIHPGVTIGAVRGLAPTIGDNVFVGPGVGIYGPVLVGNNAVLGPHSLINFSVAEGETTLGARATVRSGGAAGAQDRPRKALA